MKKIGLTLLFLSCFTTTFAANDLSKQATAFYSDNNYHKTMDLILQINDCERTAQDWLLLGNVLEDKGENDNALFMYKKATIADSKYYKAYYNIANYYAEKGQYNLAIENYKKALKLNNQNPYVYYNLACTYINQGDLNHAKISLNKAIMLKNNVPEFHYNLAYVYKKLDKQKLAQTYLDNFNKLTAKN